MQIFTIGYGGRRLDDFIKLLMEYDVDILVDVRRFPRSKNQDFNGGNLGKELSKHDINYVFMGEYLGGFRREGYEKHTETEGYERGINRLLDLASQGNVAIMCKERTSKGCHRRYIIRTLKDRGIEVIEIIRTKFPRDSKLT